MNVERRWGENMTGQRELDGPGSRRDPCILFQGLQHWWPCCLLFWPKSFLIFYMQSPGTSALLIMSYGNKLILYLIFRSNHYSPDIGKYRLVFSGARSSEKQTCISYKNLKGRVLYFCVFCNWEGLTVPDLLEAQKILTPSDETISSFELLMK